MKQSKLESMSINELWILHEKTRAILSTKLDAEKHELERRLAQLNGRSEPHGRARRPYPKVHPKYRNPERPSETLVWTRQATALGGCTAKDRKEGRRSADLAGTLKSRIDQPAS
jgi:hypothetical protein